MTRSGFLASLGDLDEWRKRQMARTTSGWSGGSRPTGRSAQRRRHGGRRWTPRRRPSSRTPRPSSGRRPMRDVMPANPNAGVAAERARRATLSTRSAGRDPRPARRLTAGRPTSRSTVRSPDPSLAACHRLTRGHHQAVRAGAWLVPVPRAASRHVRSDHLRPYQSRSRPMRAVHAVPVESSPAIVPIVCPCGPVAMRT